MLTKSAEYALRALHCLAFIDEESPVTTARLADRVGVPENYLAKLLHRLRNEGLVASRRGRGGGFELARPPHRVKLAEIVEPFDDVMDQGCLLGRDECRDDAPCAAHEAWREIIDEFQRFFRETSLEDLGAPTGTERLAATAAATRWPDPRVEGPEEGEPQPSTARGRSDER